MRAKHLKISDVFVLSAFTSSLLLYENLKWYSAIGIRCFSHREFSSNLVAKEKEETIFMAIMERRQDVAINSISDLDFEVSFRLMEDGANELCKLRLTNSDEEFFFLLVQPLERNEMV